MIELNGALTALVTPFVKGSSKIDFEAFERLLDAQLKGGISGLVPCGTTGETPTLSETEQVEVVRRTAEFVKGRVPVIAGTGSNNTKKSITSSLAALEAGASAVMIVMPYYNKPSQRGMVEHVKAIASEVKAPIVLYNIPGRSGVELSVESTCELLDACDNVVAVKDATGNLHYCQELLRRVGERVTLLSGDDPLTLPMMAVGAKGVISVTSNLYPAEVSAVARAALEGDFKRARELHLRLLPVHKVMFVEPNPQPMKAALASRGRLAMDVRLPLVAASAEARARVESVLSEYEAS